MAFFYSFRPPTSYRGMKTSYQDQEHRHSFYEHELTDWIYDLIDDKASQIVLLAAG